MKEITAPRIRLTLAYSAILVLLFAAFSFVVYMLMAAVVWQLVEPFNDDPVMVAAAQRMLADETWRLVIANAGALVVSAVAGFVLAKYQLRPLERAIALQRQFTNDASHDLRTPLAVIRTETSAALLHAEALDPADVDRLRVIDEQAQRMERLIDQLITLAHVDADSALSREPTDLILVVNSVVRDLQPLAEAKHIRLRVARADSALVMGDELKLSQMVANLIDNAIKYSPSGGDVDVSVWQSRDAAFVTVADRGRGIPASEVDKIFLRFHRAAGRADGAPSGLGLGLPLCRWIARAHGGDVAVDSSVGAGSTFTVRIPALSG